MVVIVLASFLSFKTRNRFKEFVELRHIAHSFYMVEVMCFILIPVGIGVRNIPAILAIVQLLAALLATSFPMCLIFGYLVKERFFEYRRTVSSPGAAAKHWSRVQLLK